ncbi:MAG: polysaccharide biosynthesis C-terminal domain-containing protein, partial [Acidobacteria bacterium]|nr:polysaccharide biosynthesis C-terminal domain-containing protein [Acidobacteriota bacterium]
MPPGSLTSIYVADRVNELVLGGYAIAVATAILPMMAHQAAAHDFEALKKTFAFSVRIVSFVTVPAMVGLVMLREPIINVLFQHGEFSASSTALTARALLYSAMGLPAFAAVKLIVPAFYSTKDTRTPVKIAFYAAAVNILLNYFFWKTFFQTFQNGGPAFATSLAAYFNFIALFYVFRKRFGRLGTLEILISVAKVAICSVAMGALCYFLLYFSHFLEVRSFWARLALLVFMILAATGAFLGLAWVMRCKEMEEVYGITTGRKRGGGVDEEISASTGGFGE